MVAIGKRMNDLCADRSGDATRTDAATMNQTRMRGLVTDISLIRRVVDCLGLRSRVKQKAIGADRRPLIETRFAIIVGFG